MKRRFASRVPSRAWKDAWLILSICVVLSLLLEAAYRGQAVFRLSRRQSHIASNLRGIVGGKLNPYADSAWAQSFFAERDSLTGRWEPYVYFRGTTHPGRFFTIDSSGLRVTPQAHHAGGRKLKVFFFGGSTTWGFANRDSTTRPALVARRLADLGYDPEVTNYAQEGWVSTQGMVTLIQEIRAGNVPDVVVFWDGENDVLSAWRNGRPGLSYREHEHEEDTRFGADMRRHGGTVPVPLAVRSLVMKSELLHRALQVVDRRPVRSPVPKPDALCHGVIADWLGEVKIIEAMAVRYGFVPLMIWQPTWHTSDRPRTQFEREYASVPEAWMGEVEQKMHRMECAREVDSLVGVKVNRSIINFARLHAADSGTVYFDLYGHTTERITAVEADTLVALLRQRLITKPTSHATHPEAPHHDKEKVRGAAGHHG